MYRSRTNLSITSNLVLILWLVLLGTSHEAGGQEKITAKIESRRVVDICGQKKDQVVVVINLGKIVRQDSLFGCNFQLSYDSTKIKFHSALYLNTLAEFFEFKQVGFFRNGKIIGAVATMGMTPVAGDRPLVGFLGDYIGECSDSVEIKIDYLEFTFEFKKIVDYQNGFLEANVADAANRTLKLITTSDSTVIDSLSNSGSFAVRAETVNDSTVAMLKARLTFGNFDNYILDDVIPKDTALIKIERKLIAFDTAEITFFVNGRIDNREIAEIKIAEKRKGEEIAEISVMPYEVDDCSCITRFAGSKHYIRSEKKTEDDTTGTEYDESDNLIKDRLFIRDNEWEIESTEDFELRIFDIMGNIMFERKAQAGISRIYLNGFANGVYFGEIKTRFNRTIRKILIKN